MTQNKTITFLDIVNRAIPPEPWSEGDNIPWNEPGFSKRMLKEHLTQEHDHASRKLPSIEQHVNWIHNTLLEGRPSRIVDMGCGPGLYGERLARLGHAYRGIDFSPASVEYARQNAGRENLNCTYILSDLRQADFGPDGSADLVMQIFGEMNVFRPSDFRLILAKARAVLKPGGKLLLEVSREESIRKMATGPGWFSSHGGLFAETPHLLLEETFWNEATKTATTRYFVIDAQTQSVIRFASTMQAYTQDEYDQLLADCGFGNITFYPALASASSEEPGEFFAITAVKE